MNIVEQIEKTTLLYDVVEVFDTGEGVFQVRMGDFMLKEFASLQQAMNWKIQIINSVRSLARAVSINAQAREDHAKSLPQYLNVGFTAGALDLLHEGHMKMLEEAREECDYLIVFLQSDPSIDRPEKNKPVMSLDARITMLQGISYVNAIHIYHTEKGLLDLMKDLIGFRDNQVSLKEFGGRNIIANRLTRIIGADWEGRDYTGKQLCEAHKVHVYFNSRDHGMSTSRRRQEVFVSELKREIDEPWNQVTESCARTLLHRVMENDEYKEAGAT